MGERIGDLVGGLLLLLLLEKGRLRGREDEGRGLLLLLRLHESSAAIQTRHRRGDFSPPTAVSTSTTSALN